MRGIGWSVVIVLMVVSGTGAVMALAENPDKELIAAITVGDSARVSQLLAAGAHADARDTGGTTALMVAAFGGHRDIVRLLMDYGASVRAKADNGTTALMAAVPSGSQEIVQLLLDKGADADAKEDHGLNAFRLALMYQKIELVAMLKDRTTGAASEQIRTVVSSLGEGKDCLAIMSFPDRSSDKVGCVRSGEKVEPVGIFTNSKWAMIEKPTPGWVPTDSLKVELVSAAEDQKNVGGQGKAGRRSPGITTSARTSESKPSSEAHKRSQERSESGSNEPSEETKHFRGSGGDWWRRGK